jgi:hypothetical protein
MTEPTIPEPADPPPIQEHRHNTSTLAQHSSSVQTGTNSESALKTSKNTVCKDWTSNRKQSQWRGELTFSGQTASPLSMLEQTSRDVVSMTRFIIRRSPHGTSMTCLRLLSGLKLSLIPGNDSLVGSVLAIICHMEKLSLFSNFIWSSSRMSSMDVWMFGLASWRPLVNPLELPLELLGFLPFFECFTILEFYSHSQLVVGFCSFCNCFCSFRSWLLRYAICKLISFILETTKDTPKLSMGVLLGGAFERPPLVWVTAVVSA